MTDAAPPKQRIFIVDDEAVIRDLLSRYLRAGGYEVHAAADAQEGLALFKQVRPHLMLLDIRMPGMDGLEVLRRVREADKTVAVVMITGNMDLPVAQEAMRLGACDYITKPFDMAYLNSVVKTQMLLVSY
jgi:DNA-binding NtrC family response regulator